MTSTVAPTQSPTPAPRDPEAAAKALEQFVAAVQENRLEDAWALYAASVPGTTVEHAGDRGCDFVAFSDEFPKIQHLFSQITPLVVEERYSSALGVTVVELKLRGTNGAGYLVTLARAQYHEGYQVMFLNSGEVSVVPGAPDPLPSPEFPRGFCGIWTGGR